MSGDGATGMLALVLDFGRGRKLRAQNVEESIIGSLWNRLDGHKLGACVLRFAEWCKEKMRGKREVDLIAYAKSFYFEAGV